MAGRPHALLERGRRVLCPVTKRGEDCVGAGEEMDGWTRSVWTMVEEIAVFMSSQNQRKKVFLLFYPDGPA